MSVHPKEVQMVNFDIPNPYINQISVQQDVKQASHKSTKPPLVPIITGTGRSRDSTLDFFNKLDPKPLQG